jgi:hypothetical protein
LIRWVKGVFFVKKLVMLKNVKDVTPFVVLGGVIFIIFLIFMNRNVHKDIVIKTNNEEFIIDGYDIEDDGCIYFDFEGEDKMICEGYEIID